MVGIGCKNNTANSPNSHPVVFTLDGLTPGFNAPSGICVDSSNNLYVADYGNNRVLKYDSNGNWLMTIAGPFTPVPPAGQPTQFNGPEDVSIDSSGNIYVSEGDQTNAPLILAFSSAGAYLTNWGNGGGNGQLLLPSQLTAVGGQVYVADSGHNRIAYYSAPGGGYAGMIGGTFGANLGQLHTPDGVAVDGSGNVYVGDRGNFRIEVFTALGAAVSIWGAPHAGVNTLEPMRLKFDLSGNLWVVNSSSTQLSEFNSSGSLIQTWSPEGFPNATDVAFDNTGAIWVSFDGNGVEPSQVAKFSH